MSSHEVASRTRQIQTVHVTTRRKKLLRENAWFLLLVFPNMLLFAIFTYWPIIFTFLLSFTDWNMIRPQRNFIGLENYISLFNSRIFYQVIRNTFTFAFFTVFFRIAISLGLAVLLFQKLRFRALFRTLVFLPHITTTAAAAIVWAFVLEPNFGVLRMVFNLVGLASPRWLADPNWAMPAIIMVAIWKTVGFSTIIYLAALSSVDTELQEAARIDGANNWQVFWRVTFPLLTPVTLFLVVTGLIGAMQTFEIPQILTGGGPLNATKIYAVYLYELAFERFRAGYASAFAVVFFVVILIITALNLWLSKRWVYYR
jgi:sn-glycerol 3-phosphate transport system permease protein